MVLPPHRGSVPALRAPKPAKVVNGVAVKAKSILSKKCVTAKTTIVMEASTINPVLPHRSSNFVQVVVVEVRSIAFKGPGKIVTLRNPARSVNLYKMPVLTLLLTKLKIATRRAVQKGNAAHKGVVFQIPVLVCPVLLGSFVEKVAVSKPVVV